MTFAGPLMKTSGAHDYIYSTEQLLQMDIATPDGGMITIEITDLIQVANGKAAKQKIYYDPREFAKAFGMG
ncbi:hypothetical protein Ngar_c25510 [Candidatus Nitrososphaera gargensis Ga9.2]|uniref:Uncharacterized protein n=1 Tax=Nitrososphaera gargensis (strain Ga9.2) TaxID=1237085 RepID=K0IJS4_NITGG|nr:hypothetical protein [Candidatus Nitrososphaera gargensis]AFU59473.1 hypothetical protein Ngar_c25510 [Candidatus Nitrososphaera gargensis Ga9.2]